MAGEQKVEVSEEEEQKPDPQELVEVAPPAKPEAKQEPSADEAKLEELVKQRLEDALKERIKPYVNQSETFRRKNEQLQRQLEDVKKTVQVPATQSSADAWAAIENGQMWKEEIVKLTRQEMQKALEDERKFQQQQQTALFRSQKVDQAINQVTKLYPELHEKEGNPEAVESQVYQQVLNEDNSLLSDVHGPLEAMHRMEEILYRDHGITPRSWQQLIKANPQAAKNLRVNAATLAPSRPVGTTSKMQVTREQKDFLDYSGLNPETYTKVSQALEKEGGVEA